MRSVSCSATDIVAGRLLKPGDTNHIILEETFAASDNLKPGDVLTISVRGFEIVGIMSPGTRPARGDIYMPIEQATQLINTRLTKPLNNMVNAVLVDASSSESNAGAIADVRAILGEDASTGGYGCFAPASRAIEVTRFGSGIMVLMVFIGVSMLVSVMQYFSVIERKTEMGILKAIGWSSRNISQQIIFESLIQSIAGGIVGIFIAALILRFSPLAVFIDAAQSETIFTYMWVPVTGLILTVLAGVMAGLFSSLFTLRLRPADILRKL